MAPDRARLMTDLQRPAGLDALQEQVDDLRDRLTRLEAKTTAAQEEAHQAREEAVHLRDQLAAAQRDQQDLKTTRARLARIRARGLVARFLNRP